MSGLDFTISAEDGKARRGQLVTAHGVVDTPAFMPVGTAGTVKAMHPEAVAATGAQIVLGNTYHLMLRPGADRVQALGGLHRFMNWPGPILTDSGGFQVMSLTGLRKMNEKGVTFRSHIDGSYHELTPERSIEIQHKLDANVTMVFDECAPFPIEEKPARDSMELSMRWAERSKEAFVERQGYGLFGIVQGSVYENLRLESSQSLIDIGFDGYAIGGLAVGEPQDVMFNVLDYTVPALPTGRPRYLMGVGKPADIVGAVARGIDMFDCVLPTRSGRNGQVFTARGAINLKNARHADDPRPLEEGCPCRACTSYSRAYLHHLIKAGEILGLMLATEHNLTYYQRLMESLRKSIIQGTMFEFIEHFEAMNAEGDIPVR